MAAFENLEMANIQHEDEDLPHADKGRQRELIALQVEAYLSKGGSIEEVPSDESAERHYPLKRTRRAQINFLRQRDYRRTQGDQAQSSTEMG